MSTINDPQLRECLTGAKRIVDKWNKDHKARVPGIFIMPIAEALKEWWIDGSEIGYGWGVEEGYDNGKEDGYREGSAGEDI
jgi:hypothetical protein